MIFLGFGKYARADKIYALEPLGEGDRGHGRRTRVWILNPGSPTERRKAPAHTMLLLRVEDGEIEPELVEL